MAQTRKSTSGQTGKKRSGAKGGRARQAAAPRPIRREVGALICLFLGIFSFIGYFQVDAWFITFFCGFIKGLIGWGYYLFPPALLLCAVTLGFHRGRPVIFRVISALLLPLILGALIHLLFAKGDYSFSKGLITQLYTGGQAMTCGGLLSGIISMGLEGMFSVYGATPVLIVAFVFFALGSVHITIGKLVSMIKDRPHAVYEPEPEPDPEPDPVPAKVPAQPGQKRRTRRAIDIPLDDEPPMEDEYAEDRIGFFNAKPRVKTPDQVLKPDVPPSAPEPAPEQERFSHDGNIFPKSTPPAPAAAVTGIRSAAAASAIPFTPAEKVPEPAAPAVQEICDPPRPSGKPEKIKAEDVAAETESIAKAIESDLAEEKPAYEYPPLDLLKSGKQNMTDSRSEIAMNRERLETTIRSFGVSAAITGVTRGPTVTRYDLELDAGVKLNKLTNLSNDLALSLGVSSVRIAPIPDKISTVGIEVPNKLVSTVYLRDILSTPEFQNAQSRLSFAIGKDIGGNAIVGNIAKLPHLLIAGTTGSGKSVCMNSLILSLIYKATPEEVRLIMVDPKMVELGIYNGIPHLFIPVVTDPKKAAGALQWSVVEMMKRYRLFSEVGVRDLSGYNAHQKRIGGETMPQVVIVIDELADLMLVASKEVEESICRVAQMGRASGMHLVIATQRPSADVITGLMKANIPSRIAFAVSSAMESRIILDTQGAEKLIGQGDMLYAPLGAGKPIRVQGAFVSDEEREEVIRFVKASSEADYSEDILSQIEQAAAESGKNGKNGGGKSASEPEAPTNDYDELLPQAVEVLLETKQASVSMLQRRLKLGYSRAARLVDQMEELGIVGPFEGSKPRQLLITREQWQEMQMGGSTQTGDIPGQFEPDVFDPVSEEEEDGF